MVDQNMKPWLLEVNSSPAMSMDERVDYVVKPKLLKDMLNFVDWVDYDEYQVKQKQ